MGKDKVRLPDWFTVSVSTLIALVAISTPVHLVSEVIGRTENPVIGWMSVLGESMNGWGIHKLIIALGLWSVFYAVKRKKRQKNHMAGMVSCFFAVCTVFGKSYMEIGNWEYIFHDGSQVFRALLAWGGTA